MRASFPRVSVIIPCYRQARFLGEAVDSVLDQCMGDVECVIVNDGSPDEARAVGTDLARRDPRVQYVEQENKGVSAARNLGIRRSRGQYLQFLDADDCLQSDKLSRQADYLDAHPEVGVVFGDARYFCAESPDGLEFGPYAEGRNEPWIPRLWYAPGPLLMRLLVRNLFTVNCTLMRRTAFEIAGPWDESLRALEDWEFWIRCAAAGVHFEYLEADNTFALIRMHATSMTRDTALMQRALISMRLAVGSSLREDAARELNFREGLKQIFRQKPPDSMALISRLARGNACPRVYRLACNASLMLAYTKIAARPLYQNRIPWPVQRRLGEYFRGLGTRLLAD